MLRVITTLLALAAGFGATAAVIGYLVPAKSDGVALVEAYVSRAGEFDTVFIGSSHIRHQIDPTEFDKQMEAAGKPTKSFLISDGALTHLEAHELLRQLLKRASPPPKRVFIEPNIAIYPAFSDEPNSRQIAFHSIGNTIRYWRYLDSAWAFDRSFNHHAAKLGSFKATAIHTFNIGRLAEFIRPTGSPDLGPNRDGYLPLRGQAPSFNAFLENYLATIKNRSEPDFNPVSVSPEKIESVTSIIDTAHRFGVDSFILIPPHWSAWKETAALARQLPQSRPDIAVLNLSQPSEHPELYEIPLRWDGGHLNADGAILFSQIVAKTFAGAQFAGSR